MTCVIPPPSHPLPSIPWTPAWLDELGLRHAWIPQITIVSGLRRMKASVSHVCVPRRPAQTGSHWPVLTGYTKAIVQHCLHVRAQAEVGMVCPEPDQMNRRVSRQGGQEETKPVRARA